MMAEEGGSDEWDWVDDRRREKGMGLDVARVEVVVRRVSRIKK